MATHADPAPPRPQPPRVTCGPTRPTTRRGRSWRATGPAFLAAFFCLWGLLAPQHPAVPAQRDAGRGLAALRGPQAADHDRDERLPHDGRLLHGVERGHRPGDGTYRGSRRCVVQARDDGRHDHVCAPHGGLRDVAHRRARGPLPRSRHRAHALLDGLAPDRLGVLRHLAADRRRQHRVHAGQAGEEAGPGRRHLVGLDHLRVVLRGQCHPVRHDRAAGLQRRDQLLDRVLHLVLLDPDPVLLRRQGRRPDQGRGRGSRACNA